MPALKTFGRATLIGDSWAIECEPHVAMRLKRTLPKIDERQYGQVTLSANPECSRDLEWFVTRFPLEILRMQEDGSLAPAGDELERRARAYDATAARAVEILSGRYVASGLELAIPARPYQAQAATLALTTGGLLVGDDVGLGKTIIAIAMLADPKTRPAVVACMPHLTTQWAREFERFLPGIRVHTVRSVAAYSLDDGLFGAPDVILISYHRLRGWAEHLRGRVRSFIADEVQELRHPDSQKTAAARAIAAECSYRMGLSATPIYNYGGEFWQVMQVIQPGALGTWPEFFREWCVQGYGDKPRLKQPEAFGTYLRESALMIRRTRKDVERELPPLSRIVHEVDPKMTELARVETSAVKLARIIVEGGRGFDVMQAAGEFNAQLRHATGVDKAPYVAEFVRLLLEEEDEPIVLFGWHRDVYNIWAERFADLKPAWYTGTESPKQKIAEAERFLAGDTKLLIMSLRSGAGLDGLQKIATRVVFGELDWSPATLEQCTGRVYRDGQAHPVFAYYVTATGGCDPAMIDVLGVKKQQLDGVREPFGEMQEIREVDPDHLRKLAREYLNRRRASAGLAIAGETEE